MQNILFCQEKIKISKIEFFLRISNIMNNNIFEGNLKIIKTGVLKKIHKRDTIMLRREQKYTLTLPETVKYLDFITFSDFLLFSNGSNFFSRNPISKKFGSNNIYVS